MATAFATLVSKNKATPGSVPGTGDLLLGELAVNTYDGKLYLKKDDGAESIVNVGEYAVTAHEAAADPHPQYSEPGDNVSDFVNDANYTSIGDNVSVFVNDAGYLTNITNENLDDLLDVVITTPLNKEALVYDTGNWVNEPVVNSIFGRTGDVGAQVGDYSSFYTQPGDNISSFTNDANYTSTGDNISVFTNDSGYITGITGEVLNDLSDVVITSVSDGEALVYDSGSGNWINQAVAGGVTSVFGRTGAVVATEGDYDLDELGDVTITAPADGEVLTYDSGSGEWINGSGGGSAGVELIDYVTVNPASPVSTTVNYFTATPPTLGFKLDASIPATDTYRITLSVVIRIDYDRQFAVGNLWIDGTEVSYSYFSIEPKDKENRYWQTMHIYTSLTAGTRSIEFRFGPSDDRTTYFYSGSITVERVLI